MTPVVPFPALINTGFVGELDRIRQALQPGQRGTVSGVVTTEGVSASAALRPFRQIKGFQVEGWAQRQWGAPGWASGARASFTW